MVIERVEEYGKGKVTVYLEDGSSFAMYRRELRHFDLEPGAELTSEQFETIHRDILMPRARKRAMHLLEQMDRTEAQLCEKLRQNGYPEDIVEDAIAYVKKFHYVDDLRYASNYVRCRSQSKSWRQLSLELMRKGISREIVEQALGEEYEEADETAKIMRWVEKKHYDAGTADFKEKQKMYQFLMRKGFCSEDILRVIS